MRIDIDNSKELKKERILLVEGINDSYFFAAIFEKLDIKNIQIENYDGKDNLEKILKALPTRPGFQQLIAIGITRDADNDKAENVFKTIQDYLNRKDFCIPKTLKEFTEIKENKPAIGIFIVPDCKNFGELEALCCSSISDEFSLMECVEQFLGCANRKKKNNKPAKSKLYAWLSIQNLPSDARLGIAVNNSYFNFEHPEFKNLIEFIQVLNAYQGALSLPEPN